jgi:ArsR family transcriptional regulator, arsenate/arsenite/antimonite-responsive transcriptional repressor
MYGKLVVMSSRLPSQPAPDWVACCTPLTGEPLNADTAHRLATVLKAIAEPTRLRLLSLVAAHANAEACICDLTKPVHLSQPTVSHHMKVLVDAGLLTREQRGKWAYYRLIPGAFDALAQLLSTSSKPHANERP